MSTSSLTLRRVTGGVFGALLPYALTAAAAVGLAAAGAPPVVCLGAPLVALLIYRRIRRARARRRGHRRLDRTRLKFTGLGQAFVGLTLAVGVAAINTGNNLLFLILGMQLSMIVVSGVLSEVALRGLEVSRLLPREVHARTPFLTGVTLANHKGQVPSFSIEVEDILDEQPSTKKCFFLKVPPGATLQTSYRGDCALRGVQRFAGCVLSTRFPFGFFRKSRPVAAPDELVVFPQVKPVGHLLGDPRGEDGPTPQAQRGQGQEFHGLRHYRQGDDARDIHWKRSARTGRLIVREHARSRAHQVTLLVNTTLAPDAPALPPALADEVATLAASALTHFMQAGHEITLLTDRARHHVSADGRGLSAAMRTLALMEFTHGEAMEAPPRGPRGQRSTRVLITHPRGARLSGHFDHTLAPEREEAAA